MRLRPLTEYVPKVLMEIDGQPALQAPIERAIEAGFSEIIFSVSRLSDEIERYVESIDLKQRIKYSFFKDTGPPRVATQFADHPTLFEEPFMVLYPDVFQSLPFAQIAKAHESDSRAATVVLRPVNGIQSVRSGIAVVTEHGRITDLIGGGESARPMNPLGASGIFVFAPDVQERLQRQHVAHTTKPYMWGHLARELVAAGEDVKAYTGLGLWQDFGNSLKKYWRLNQAILATQRARRISPDAVLNGSQLLGPITMGPRCNVGFETVIRNSTIGTDVHIGDGCLIEDSVIHAGAVVLSGTRISSSIVGSDSTVALNTISPAFTLKLTPLTAATWFLPDL